MKNYEIYDDKAVRFVPVKACEGNLVKAEMIITKEEFLACYNAWVLGNAWENGCEVKKNDKN
jgi:hypothetical protein